MELTFAQAMDIAQNPGHCTPETIAEAIAYFASMEQTAKACKGALDMATHTMPQFSTKVGVTVRDEHLAPVADTATIRWGHRTVIKYVADSRALTTELGYQIEYAIDAKGHQRVVAIREPTDPRARQLCKELAVQVVSGLKVHKAEVDGTLDKSFTTVETSDEPFLAVDFGRGAK